MKQKRVAFAYLTFIHLCNYKKIRRFAGYNINF